MNRKSESGAALVIALIMMIVLTLIGLASTFTSTFEIILSGEKKRSTDAFMAGVSSYRTIRRCWTSHGFSIQSCEAGISTMGISTPQRLVQFGIPSIGILSVGCAGSTNDWSDIRDGRGDSLPVLRGQIQTCSSTGVLEYFRAVE